MGEVMTQPFAIFTFASCLLLMLAGANVRAKTYTADAGNYIQTLHLLSPGDTLQLEPGYYRGGLRLHGLHGEEGAPITITGPRVGPRSVLLGRPGHNTVSIKNAAYVTVRDLELDGRGAFVDAVKAEGNADYAHHITLENLHIHNYAHEQQSVGISTKCPAWDWVVRGNLIEEVGTGMYFGNSNGRDPFIGGLIEGNTIVNTIGYNLQIKHQVSRPSLQGIPTNRRFTVIRRNQFEKAHDSSSGVAARPNVLVGHFPLRGAGSDDGHLIYQNLFFQNSEEALFQGEGNISLYSNLFFNSYPVNVPAIVIQPHNGEVGDVKVFFNTVVHPKAGIRLARKRTADSAATVLIGNAIFSAEPLQGADPGANFLADYNSVNRMLVSPVSDRARLLLRPLPGKLLGVDLQMGEFAALPEFDRDFANALRKPSGYGAFDPTVIPGPQE
ncbi:MAG: hypothetical protein H6961_04160 [Chromatiaceae bacterium]|nr:hypothetical protein [Chromatiaceae bacterium]